MDEADDPALGEWASRSADVLAARVVEFAHLIRAQGIGATSGRVIDAQRSLHHIDLGQRDDFYHALRANLIASPEEIPTFDVLFDRYWRGMATPPVAGQESDLEPMDAPPRSEDANGHNRTQRRTELSHAAEPDDQGHEEGASYSAIEALVDKDFSTLDSSELKQIQQMMNHIAPRLLTVRSRRFRSARSGTQLDFPRTLRRSLYTGGTVIELSWRKRRVDTARLVLLCDVSHSMESYSRFLIQFMYAFQNELPSTETFVFSTRLTRLTSALRGRHLDNALAQAKHASAGWSSGTKIGECLEQFIADYGVGRLDRRTVVVIVSDGWDQGDPEVLGEQMALIKRRSKLVVWLNPLLADVRYRPLVAGMRAALPHVDLFLPCHNLASLQAFAAALRKM